MLLQMRIVPLSLNVRGLGNQVKQRSIFSFLEDQNCDIFLLQGTILEPRDEYGRYFRPYFWNDLPLSIRSRHSKKLF